MEINFLRWEGRTHRLGKNTKRWRPPPAYNPYRAVRPDVYHILVRKWTFFINCWTFLENGPQYPCPCLLDPFGGCSFELERSQNLKTTPGGRKQSRNLEKLPYFSHWTESRVMIVENTTVTPCVKVAQDFVFHRSWCPHRKTGFGVLETTYEMQVSCVLVH